MALKVDLDAANITSLSDGDPVATWSDASGNSNNATQATSTKRPLYRTGSGTPYLEFDGTDDFVAIPYAIGAGQALTVYVRVWSTETGSTYRNIYDGPNTLTRSMIWADTAGKVEFDLGDGRSAAAHRGGWVSIAYTHAAGSAKPIYYVNGSVVTNSGAAYTLPAWVPQWFNRAGASTWKGRVARVRVYDHVLSAAEISALDATPGTFAASIPVPTSSFTGSYSAPPNTGAFAVDLPVAAASFTGSYTPPDETGTFAVDLPVPVPAFTGSYQAPPTGSFAATLTVPVADFTGSYAAPVVDPTGVFAVDLPVPVVDFAGGYTPPPISGTFGVDLPLPVAEFAGVTGSIPGSFGVSLPLPTVVFEGAYGGPYPTDTSNLFDGLNLVCIGYVTQTRAAVTPPTAPPKYDKALPYSEPVMVDGRPT